MNIVLCDRCGNEIPEAARLAKPVYPVYSARQTALDRYTGAEMAADVTLCPVCREQLKAFLCCADRAPVTETLARNRALRRARMRSAMEGAYYAENRT